MQRCEIGCAIVIQRDHSPFPIRIAASCRIQVPPWHDVFPRGAGGRFGFRPATRAAHVGEQLDMLEGLDEAANRRGPKETPPMGWCSLWRGNWGSASSPLLYGCGDERRHGRPMPGVPASGTTPASGGVVGHGSAGAGRCRRHYFCWGHPSGLSRAPKTVAGAAVLYLGAAVIALYMLAGTPS